MRTTIVLTILSLFLTFASTSVHAEQTLQQIQSELLNRTNEDWEHKENTSGVLWEKWAEAVRNTPSWESVPNSTLVINFAHTLLHSKNRVTGKLQHSITSALIKTLPNTSVNYKRLVETISKGIILGEVHIDAEKKILSGEVLMAEINDLVKGLPADQIGRILHREILDSATYFLFGISDNEVMRSIAVDFDRMGAMWARKLSLNADDNLRNDFMKFTLYVTDQLLRNGLTQALMFKALVAKFLTENRHIDWILTWKYVDKFDFAEKVGDAIWSGYPDHIRTRDLDNSQKVYIDGILGHLSSESQGLRDAIIHSLRYLPDAAYEYIVRTIGTKELSELFAQSYSKKASRSVRNVALSRFASLWKHSPESAQWANSNQFMDGIIEYFREGFDTTTWLQLGALDFQTMEKDLQNHLKFLSNYIRTGQSDATIPDSELHKIAVSIALAQAKNRALTSQKTVDQIQNFLASILENRAVALLKTNELALIKAINETLNEQKFANTRFRVTRFLAENPETLNQLLRNKTTFEVAAKAAAIHVRRAAKVSAQNTCKDLFAGN